MQLTQLTEQLQKASDQVQSIAEKAVEGSSFTRLNQSYEAKRRSGDKTEDERVKGKT